MDPDCKLSVLHHYLLSYCVKRIRFHKACSLPQCKGRLKQKRNEKKDLSPTTFVYTVTFWNDPVSKHQRKLKTITRSLICIEIIP